MERAFTKEAKELVLENNIDESCLFTWRNNSKFVIMVVYVDDILLTGND